MLCEYIFANPKSQTINTTYVFHDQNSLFFIVYWEDLVIYNDDLISFKCKEKLHFTTINYTSYYTLHLKLFECNFCILNYDHCYILHPDIKFAVILNGKIWHHVKRPNCSFSQYFKNKRQITFFHPKLYSLLYFAP